MRAARIARPRTVLVWSVATGLAVCATFGSAGPAAPLRTARAAARPAPLRFGIYPGGPVGTVGPGGRVVPDNGALQLAALEQLRASGRPFVLRLYVAYSGLRSRSAADQVGRQIADYTAAGFEIELVLTYRPTDADPERDVPGYVAFVRNTVKTLGATRAFVSLQVTNEVNVRSAPNAADGYYRGADDALIEGVIAAKTEARRDGFCQIAIGFNWAYSFGPAERSFWQRLRTRGGRAFRRSVDWVGLDVYPGTWGPKSRGRPLGAWTTKTMFRSFAALRHGFISLAGLPPLVSLHVSENGFPTGPRRTQAMQVTVMRGAIRAANADRARYRITDYRWFDLRDADSASPNVEDHYGLMDDQYAPKSAFNAYRVLIATLG